MIEKTWNGEHVGVGVGCLTILPSVLVESPESDDVRSNLARTAWWKAKIESGLGSLPSITDLRVEVTGTVQRHGPNNNILDKYIDQIQQFDLDFNPGPSTNSFIAFNITIPKRMQADLMKGLIPAFDTERFEFFTIYGVDGPATFIRSRDESEVKYAHYYPFLVREFLIKELERVNAGVRVVVTGPSPFHANVAIVPAREASETVDEVDASGLAFSWTEVGPMDDVKFYYDPDSQAPDSVYPKMVEMLRDPLSTFYSQVRARNRRMDRGSAVTLLTQDLIAKYSRTGLRAWLVRTFRSGALAREVTLAAITAAQLDISERTQHREVLSQASVRIKIPRLAELSRKEAEESYLGDFEMAKEVASALETGRMNQYEVLMVSLSTLFGGVAGAVAALIAG